ncbi:MAG: hypothetical protein IAE90_08350 [Ignavibacteria bacterium]|nr:hypothetical protein [Ignavibacteria bacterium]
MQKIIKKVLFALIPVVVIFLIGAGDCSQKNIKYRCGSVTRTATNSKDTLYSGTTKDLFGVDFYSPGIGSIVGQSGTILKTFNGGLNWSPQTSGTGMDLKDIRMLNKDTAVAVGKNGTILRTSDKGITWGVVTSPVPTDLNAICFTNSVTGYIAGNSGVLLKSVNSGLTWVQLTSNTTKHLYDVDFSDATTGCAAGETGRIMRTTNAGATWDTASSTVSTDLYSIDFLDTRGISVGAGGKIVSTTDAGANWVGVASPTTNNLRGVKYCLPKLAYAVGDNGTNLIFKTGWTIIPPVTTVDIYGINSCRINVGTNNYSLPSAHEIGKDGRVYIANPIPTSSVDTCQNSAISLEHQSTSCKWCAKVTGFTPSTTVPNPFTHLIVSCTINFGYAACESSTEEMIYGESLYDVDDVVMAYAMNGSNFKLQLSPTNSGPTNYNTFRFYLMSADYENVCYIELDDIVCCAGCENEIIE